MAGEQLAKVFIHDPREVSLWPASMQGAEHGQRLHHVTQSAGLDQANPPWLELRQVGHGIPFPHG